MLLRVIQLVEDVTGILKASEISIDRVEDARNVLKEGEELEVKIVNLDRKNRSIGLSIKAKDIEEERQAVKEHQKQERGRDHLHEVEEQLGPAQASLFAPVGPAHLLYSVCQHLSGPNTQCVCCVCDACAWTSNACDGAREGGGAMGGGDCPSGGHA